MSSFVQNTQYEVVHCCSCSMPFAMTADFRRRRLADHKSFYCPAGHGQSYCGQNEADRLRGELQRAQAQAERAESKAAAARHERDKIAKAHRRMRQRVMNGVCPCCNRSFENIRNHMRDMHPDYGRDKTLRELRQAFGMTQEDVAQEAGVSPPQVSRFENSRPMPAEARQRLEGWVDAQSAA